MATKMNEEPKMTWWQAHTTIHLRGWEWLYVLVVELALPIAAGILMGWFLFHNR